MSVNTINTELLAKMFLAAANTLESKKEWINELNVFPVPDGDTGTNMTMTIMSAAKEVASIQDMDLSSLCKAISSGSLRGARGNSGVILSQLFRGFTKGINECDTIDINAIASASVKAVETAYKAVMKPKEGTILTVAKGISDKAVELAGAGCNDMSVFLNEVLKHGQEVLNKTPEMLPVLKQAGVVDSGGQGLIVVLTGAIDCFNGKAVDTTAPSLSGRKVEGPMSKDEISTADIKFGYCTEFIILLDKVFNIQMENDFKEFLESIGDSIVVVADDEIVKVHVHSNDPGLAIQRALKYGELSNLKIDNMRLEHRETVFKEEETKRQKAAQAVTKEEVQEQVPVELKKYGFISVSVGDGINEIMKSIGVDEIIEGGQTMNPSTEDILNAINKVNAENIYVLPNNKNIIMAANQAASLSEDKNVIVIPTKTIPQGISCMLNFIEEEDVDTNTTTMTEALGNIVSGQVTYAVRDTMINDKEIRQGDYMGIGDGDILTVGQDLKITTLSMIKEMCNEDTCLVSVYYGSDITEDDAQALSEMISNELPDIDVEVQKGGQPIYYYIVSAE